MRFRITPPAPCWGYHLSSRAVGLKRLRPELSPAQTEVLFSPLSVRRNYKTLLYPSILSLRQQIPVLPLPQQISVHLLILSPVALKRKGFHNPRSRSLSQMLSQL